MTMEMTPELSEATVDGIAGALAQAKATFGHLQARRGSLGLDVRSGRADQAALDKLWDDLARASRHVEQLEAMLALAVQDEQENRAARRQEIITLLIAALADGERQRDEALAAIRSGPRPMADQVTAVRDQELWVYALANTLAGETGDARYRARMILPLAAALGPEFGNQRLGMASTPPPWQSLLDELAALDAEG